MKVILNQNVENVGSVGEVVKVSDGFARNYLIPQGWAATATPGNMRVIELEQSKAIAKEKESRAKAEEAAKRARTLQLTIEATAGDDGKLFGSVTSAEIAELLATHQIDIDKKLVRPTKAIRTTGSFEVELRLHHSVKAMVRVLVTVKKTGKEVTEAKPVKEVKEPKEVKAVKEDAKPAKEAKEPKAAKESKPSKEKKAKS